MKLRSPLRASLIMAIRELRSSRRTLLILTGALSLGIAVMVFAHSLSLTIRHGIESQAKALLGADLKVSSKEPFSKEMESLFTSSQAETATEVQFRSMALFSPQNAEHQARLVQVKAYEGSYPFYGEVETTPPHLWSKLEERGVLVDEGLLLQTGTAIGDSLTLGSLTLPIKGAVKRFPGESPFSGVIASRIYVHRSLLPETFLLQKESIADYAYLLRFSEENIKEAFLNLHKPRLQSAGITFTTVEDRREMLGEVNKNVRTFFDIVGVMALLLGGIASAASLYAHLAKKRLTVGIMKCLGATTLQIRVEVTVLLLIVGIVSGVLGSAIGILASTQAVALTASLLRLPLTATVEYSSILLGLLIGSGTVLASWREMSRLSYASPLLVVRPTAPGGEQAFTTRAVLPLLAIIVSAYLWYSTGSIKASVLYTVSIGATLGSMTLAAALLRRGIQLLPSQSLPFSLRHGLRSIWRPQNQTILLTVCLSVALLLSYTIFTARALLNQQVALTRGPEMANVFVYDVQPDQREGTLELLKDQHLELKEEVPIVLMRIQSIKGVSAGDILSKKDSPVPPWTLRREYWSTYRSHLIDNEILVSGEWVGQFKGNGPIPLSIEEKLAGNLGVTLGDEIVWNIQGVEVTTRVASTRKVLWERMRRNAFIVFPEGVLEEAPGFLFLTTRTNTAEETSSLQRAIFRSFPNVSVIDIRAIVERVEEIFSMIGQAASVVAGALSCTALLALLASLWVSKEARMRDAALMRIVGATRKQLRAALTAELIVLLLLSIVLAGVLSLILGYVLATVVFRSPMVIPITEMTTVTLLFVLLVLASSLALYRGKGRPALEELRRGGE